MKPDIFERFDNLMSRLKPIEPTESFDREFKRRLDDASSMKGMRHIFVPEAPALAGAVAGLLIVLSLGLYIYALQPASPISLSKSGIVLVRSAAGIEPKEMVLAKTLKMGDIIITKEGARADIGLANRYAIRIKENSRIRIAKLSPRYVTGKAVFELLEGKMLVNIEQGFKGSKFIVDTKTATATALGTRFMVDFATIGKVKTDVSVLEGKVEVKGRYKPEEPLLARQSVIVGSGQKTEVSMDGLPLRPERLVEKEWEALEELYQVGKKPQVILLVKNKPDRVKELLRPCPIYISDEKPREIPRLLEDAVFKIEEAIKTGDGARHLEGIRLLERIVAEHPNPKYDVQLLLYIGAYYEYLSDHKNAIRTFENIVKRYPDSPFASLAQAAIGVIYEEKLNDAAKAYKAFKAVLTRYPNSLEAIWVEEKLGLKKAS